MLTLAWFVFNLTKFCFLVQRWLWGELLLIQNTHLENSAPCGRGRNWSISFEYLSRFIDWVIGVHWDLWPVPKPQWPLWSFLQMLNLKEDSPATKCSSSCPNPCFGLVWSLGTINPSVVRDLLSIIQWRIFKAKVCKLWLTFDKIIWAN